jgi:hypothetical protein
MKKIRQLLTKLTNAGQPLETAFICLLGQRDRAKGVTGMLLEVASQTMSCAIFTVVSVVSFACGMLSSPLDNRKHSFIQMGQGMFAYCACAS